MQKMKEYIHVPLKTPVLLHTSEVRAGLKFMSLLTCCIY